MIKLKYMKKTQNIRKITKIGRSSFAVVIPATDMKSLGWKERQRVIVKRVPRGLMVLDAITNYKSKHKKRIK
jgi:bifunctional DNA-binding transcriptional regulator/antitoxin component of YhaV-PrlF toxin-antitoxin module